MKRRYGQSGSTRTIVLAALAIIAVGGIWAFSTWTPSAKTASAGGVTIGLEKLAASAEADSTDPKPASIGGVGVGLVKVPISSGNMGVGLTKTNVPQN